MMRRMNPFDAPSDFRMPISRVRCSTAMYIERQTTANPITTPIPMITPDELAQALDVVHVEHRRDLFHAC